MDSSYRRDSNSHKNSIFEVLLCGCCSKSSSASSEILLEESGMDNVERKQFTVMFGPCPKGIGIKVESTISGPKVVKVSHKRWSRLREGDKILSINNENCVDSTVDMVRYVLLNLYKDNEAVFEVERENRVLKVGVCRKSDDFGIDLIRSTHNPNYIEVNSIHSDDSNEIDGGMINTDDLQSMLDSPGNKTKLIVERLV